MIIIDTALKQRLAEGNPVRVALVASGYMGRAIVRVIHQSFPGIRVAAIANRTVARAEETYREAGVKDFRAVATPAELDRAIENGVCAVTDDPAVACRAGRIEAVIETSGDVEFGAIVALEALTHGKHVVLMNAEVDAAVGPILKAYADRHDAVYTYTDGDEPGVAMNLFRFVASIGYKPVMLGQIKGFLNRYRNPDTQKEFAAKHGQKPAMVASFADGSKLALEATIMANGTGFKPAIVGMHGHSCKHVKDLLQHFKPEDFAKGGLVDFALGAEPGTGAFVIGYNDDPVLKQYMAYFKFGEGPLYLFYTPYHLPHLQLPHSVARAVLFRDPTLTPLGAPVCEAVAYAKRDLKAGEILDGMGGFTNYGLVDTYENSRAQDYLPMSLSVGCTLLRDVAKDAPLRYADVRLPAGRTCDRLRAEQTARFPKAVPVSWS
ncbi:MAG TPA: SAF domain-containing protein [Steroidobacteraceae bacterium]|nr:SAF domain-containing protein [Steroidobacteraceae bacterium]